MVGDMNMYAAWAGISAIILGIFVCTLTIGCGGPTFETDLFPGEPSTVNGPVGHGAGGEEPTSGTAGEGGADGPGGGDVGAGGHLPCAHTPCAAGEPLDSACDAVVATVCHGAFASCCTEWWTADCSAQWYYTFAPDGGGCPLDTGLCEHSPCEVGAPLAGGMMDSCSVAVSALCRIHPSCCSESWNDICVALVVDYCSGADCVC